MSNSNFGLLSNSSTTNIELTRCQAPSKSYFSTKSPVLIVGSNSRPILQIKQAKITLLD